MLGKDPFREPRSESFADPCRHLERQMTAILQDTDRQSLGAFRHCRIRSISEQSVIAEIPSECSAKIARHITAWENIIRQILERSVVLVIRTLDAR